jgi:hypothetical protein
MEDAAHSLFLYLHLHPATAFGVYTESVVWGVIWHGLAHKAGSLSSIVSFGQIHTRIVW